jgi:hypothetical protein
MFPRIREDFKEKSSIPQGLPCGSSFFYIKIFQPNLGGMAYNSSRYAQEPVQNLEFGVANARILP